jgi:hypothetical protein
MAEVIAFEFCFSTPHQHAQMDRLHHDGEPRLQDPLMVLAIRVVSRS